MTVAVEREDRGAAVSGAGMSPFSPLTGPVTANQQQGWKRETRSRGSEMGQGSKDLLRQCHPQRRAVILSESSGEGVGQERQGKWGRKRKEEGGGRKRKGGRKGSCYVHGES